MSDARRLPRDQVQGQGQGHETLKVRNPYIFKVYLPAI